MISNILSHSFMSYFLMGPFKFFIVGILLFLSLAGVSQSVNFKNVYLGKNLYVLNPFSIDSSFCTKEVYLNGVKVMENIQSSAYEIDLSRFRISDTVFTIIKHKQGCKPKLLRAGPIGPSHGFQFLKAFIVNDSFNIETKGEKTIFHKGNFFYTDTLGIILNNTNNSKRSSFYIEKYNDPEKKANQGWQIIESFKGKDSEGINSYKIKITKLTRGSNKLRIKWVAPDDQVFYSTVIEYIKKRK